MSYPISVTDSQVFTALRTFLLAAMSISDAVQGDDNRVAMLKGDFALMTRTDLRRLATNETTYVDLPLATPSIVELKIEKQSVQMSVQVDVYGPNAPDNATILATAWRSDIACEALAGTPVQPLYCDDPRFMPITDSEKQYEYRYVVELFLQYNPAVSVPQQFFDVVDGSTIRVDPVDIFVKEN